MWQTESRAKFQRQEERINSSSPGRNREIGSGCDLRRGSSAFDVLEAEKGAEGAGFSARSSSGKGRRRARRSSLEAGRQRFTDSTVTLWLAEEGCECLGLSDPEMRAGPQEEGSASSPVGGGMGTENWEIHKALRLREREGCLRRNPAVQDQPGALRAAGRREGWFRARGLEP